MTNRIDRTRLGGVLGLRGQSFRAFAGSIGVSPVHLRAVCAGTRLPSERLLNAVAKELGDAMPFVTGAADVLDVRVAAAITSTDTRGARSRRRTFAA
jgi:transcriptional regulator with XRE-family HTH domain